MSRVKTQAWSAWSTSVGDADGLVDRVDLDDPGDRPEDLLAGEAAAARQAIDERRREPAAVAGSADEHASAEGDGLVQRRLDTICRGIVHDRPEVGRRVERGAVPKGPGPLDEELAKPFGDAALDDDALDVEAVLARRPEGAGRDGRRRRLEVGIAENDGRRVGAQLEGKLLPAGDADDVVADLGAAGEGDHRNPGIADELVPDRGATAGDDLEDLLRQAGSPERLGEAKRAERGLAMRLDDDRVAAGERGPDLVGDEVQRVVEGRDRDDDAKRLADPVDDLVLAAGPLIEGERLAVEPPRLLGGQAQGLDGAAHLGARLPDRLDPLARDWSRRRKHGRPRRGLQRH
jgi:hypothetical protein